MALRFSIPLRLLFLGLIFGLASGVWAQENAVITGTVTDSTGAVVPSITITLTNPATGQVRTDNSSSSGTYNFPNLGVGTYNLTAGGTGFQKYSRTGIVVNVAQTLREDVLLTVGSEGQTVTVHADALQTQTETSDISTLISGQQVTQLATNGRNVTALAALGLGVANNLPAFAGVNALTSANGISFNGTRVSHNVYMLDGGELNDRGCGGCFSSLPAIDALSEFQTLDSNYPPDYGVGSGGVVLMVIKSGSHDFHGSAYYFNRNEDYDANNYFTKAAGQGRPKFRLNEPGFNIGGPVWIPHVYNSNRNRTFFFVNEEWRRLIQGSSPTTANTIAASNFPTLGQPLNYTIPSNGVAPIVPATSNAPLYPANWVVGQPIPTNPDGTITIPANLIDQNAVRELNQNTFPHPNFGTNQYVSSVAQPTTVREDVVRIDHTINSKLALMGHYLHDQTSQAYYPPLWSDGSYPTVGSTLLNPSWAATVKLTQTLSPNLLNETAFLYSGNTIHLDPVAGAGSSYTQPTGWDQTTFFTGNNDGNRLPEIDLGAPYSTNWTSSYFPWKNSYEGYNTRDDLSWTRGKHQMKFGFAWLHDPKNQQLQANTQGTAVFNNNTYTKDSYVNFVLGDTASFTQLNFLAGKHWVNNNYSFYVNDNFHVSSELTLNVGIRFDGMPHAFERFNQFANFYPASFNATTASTALVNDGSGTLNPAALTPFAGGSFYLNGIREAGVNGFPRGVVKNSYNSWQPRIGFAFNPGGDGKMVIRGGFGMFFERVQGNDVYNAALNPPFAYQPSANNVYFSNPNISTATGTVPAVLPSFPSTLTSLSYNYPNPGTAEFSFGVQRQLAPSIVAVVQYVGTTGWHQSDDRHINTLPLFDPANGSYDNRQAVAGGANANLYRQFLGFSDVNQEETETNANYNGLQAGLRIENKHGVTVTFAYTYSHETDQVSSDLGGISNPFNTAYDRGSGTLDQRHIFNASYIYALPFFLHSSNMLERTALGGWEVSGITSIHSGAPQYITYTGPDTLGLGGGTTNRPDLVAKVHYPKTRLAWFSTNSFAAPIAPWVSGAGGANAGFGSAGKDAVRLPGLQNWNLSLFKTVPLSSKEGGPGLELRFESFNVFNHTQFNAIDANTNDSNFGQVTSAYDPRTLQLGAKIHF
ncbi:Oar protein [Acidisarcina polymorpha]|uniref:Oar protein n=1 Tax=Acidisarcina polymorpha TaxID=2211140 RepID=A0A2Z5G2B7_9BACT|nr:carboxypeptidase-like regulatory domain-containing protein [Acidisarcina polymorpha]AXC13343.1 Oar protein [Acidisarcina polymorpha]